MQLKMKPIELNYVAGSILEGCASLWRCRVRQRMHWVYPLHVEVVEVVCGCQVGEKEEDE
jgi:hypothetical protein